MRSVIYSNSWRVSIIKLGTNLPLIGLRSLSRRFFSKIVEIIIWRDILAHLFGVTRKCCNGHTFSNNMARSSRKPCAANNGSFSLLKRGAKLKSDLPKSNSLVFRLPVFNSSVCATYSSPPKKFETLILTCFLRQLFHFCSPYPSGLPR